MLRVGPANPRGGCSVGRCFSAFLLLYWSPHCCLEVMGGEQRAEVSSGIGHVLLEVLEQST